MRLPSSTSLHRRDAVSGGLLALLSTTLSSTALFSSPGRALAAYTVIPSGTIVEKQARLKEVEKLFEEADLDGAKALNLEARPAVARRRHAQADRLPGLRVYFSS